MEIGEIIAIVRKAAELMQPDRYDITLKDGYANIVTTADIAVQEFLRRSLSQLVPGSGFICEEETVHDDAHHYVWIIDPIDGTANFSRGIDQCAISVGLKDTEGMLMGVVYVPRTQEMFWAERGKGSWRNGERIHVSERPFADGILCTALPVYHKQYAALCSEIILDVFGQCNDLRRFGAAAPELCYLAMGRVDLYFEYRLGAWDFAAASLIVSEAGGVLSAVDGTALDVTQPSGVVAANGSANLTRLLSIIRAHQ